jgi:mRNA interferase HigB
MLVLNARELDRFGRKHRDVRNWLETWRQIVEDAEWHSIEDVRQVFNSADGIPLHNLVVTVFNVKGNEYRLVTRIEYDAQRVLVLFVMTHAEYSKNRWKGRL